MVFFEIKVNACILINPIINYNFWGNHFKIPYFTYTAKDDWKEDCNSNNALPFFRPST